MHLTVHRAAVPALLAIIIAVMLLPLGGVISASPDRALAQRTPPPPTPSPTPSLRFPIVMRNAIVETGMLVGRVVDATTNAAIAGARVCQTDGLCATASATGAYTLPVTVGSRNVRVSAAGYENLTTRIDIAARQTITRVLALSTPLLDGQWRFVLTWDAQPPDLDAFLWLPDGSAVFWGARGDCDPNPPSPAVGACLEQDSRDGYGPETMTITAPRGGGYYTLGVHRYDDPSDTITEPPITTSGARLHVYDTSGQQLEFRVPAEGEGQFWYVLDLDATGLLTPYNAVSDHNPYAGLSSAIALQQHGLPIKPR